MSMEWETYILTIKKIMRIMRILYEVASLYLFAILTRRELDGKRGRQRPPPPPSSLKNFCNS